LNILRSISCFFFNNIP